MKNRNIYFYSSTIITIAVITLLTTGSSLLTIALDNDKKIPLGTFITWAGIISLPLSIYWGIKEMRIPSTKFNKIISKLLKTVIIFAILWVPISYLLAGNLSFSFGEKETFQGGQTAMKLFWYLSYGTAIGTILCLILYWISLLFKNR